MRKLIPEHVFARTDPIVPAQIALRSGLCHKPPMIEQVAQARTSRHPWLKAAQARMLARTAIAAMKEPADAMTEAGSEAIEPRASDCVWVVSLDATLAEN
jgi:hypothetical protein